MKKKYTKPYIAVESFQLDAAVASCCTQDGKLGINYGINDCTSFEEAPNLNLFGAACYNLGVDVVNHPGSDGNDTYCYHGPLIDVNDIFLNS